MPLAGSWDSFIIVVNPKFSIYYLRFNRSEIFFKVGDVVDCCFEITLRIVNPTRETKWRTALSPETDRFNRHTCFQQAKEASFIPQQPLATSQSPCTKQITSYSLRLDISYIQAELFLQ